MKPDDLPASPWLRAPQRRLLVRAIHVEARKAVANLRIADLAADAEARKELRAEADLAAMRLGDGGPT